LKNSLIKRLKNRKNVLPHPQNESLPRLRTRKIMDRPRGVGVLSTRASTLLPTTSKGPPLDADRVARRPLPQMPRASTARWRTQCCCTGVDSGRRLGGGLGAVPVPVELVRSAGGSAQGSGPVVVVSAALIGVPTTWQATCAQMKRPGTGVRAPSWAALRRVSGLLTYSGATCGRN
jgi:hypothetical protein